MSVTFENNSISVKNEIEKMAGKWLHESAGEVCAQATRNTKVDTGKTKGSWNIAIDYSSMTAQVGSSYENAIWEEFGTGEYADNGKGRKGGWFYKTPDGKGHFTIGKRPKFAFRRGYRTAKPVILRRASELFKGVGK